MRELPVLERVRHQGQLGDRSRDAEPLGRGARRIAHRAFQVLEEGPEAEGAPQLDLLGIPQQARLLGVQRRPPRRDPAELAVHSCPLRCVLALPRFGRGRVVRPRAPVLPLACTIRHAISNQGFRADQ
jgi:hypothetical protein